MSIDNQEIVFVQDDRLWYQKFYLLCMYICMYVCTYRANKDKLCATYNFVIIYNVFYVMHTAQLFR